MRSPVVALFLAAGLAFACRSGGLDPQAAEGKSAEPAAVAALPILPPEPTAAEGKPASAPADARAERLAALVKEQAEAMNAYYEAFQAALGDNQNPTPEDLKKIRETVKEPDAAGYLARAQALLDEDVTDLTAFETLQWMFDNAPDAAARKTALGLIEKHHLDRPELGDLCGRLAQNGSELLAQLAASSPHAEVRGRACYAMAEGLKNDIQISAYLKDAQPEGLAGMREYLGDEKLAALAQLDVDATQKEIERIYERVLSEFPGVVLNAGSKRETTLGKQAGAALYEIRSLAVGKTTPEIEGVDLDRVAFKLSDYRGKVVLLDFWGNW